MAAEGSDSSAASVLGRRPTCYEESEYWNLHMGDIHREDFQSNLMWLTVLPLVPTPTPTPR